MSAQKSSEQDARLAEAIQELTELIHSQFPDATVSVSQGEDPDGVYLDAMVDRDDPDVVMDLVVDRLLALQIDEDLPIHIVPRRTPERVMGMLSAARADQHRPVALFS